MANLKMAVAQFNPTKGDIEQNTEKHRQLIHDAVNQNVDIIIFPELSLTGYEPELANILALSKNDSRLDVFKDLANTHHITIIVGAPIKRNNNNPYIGQFIIRPNIEPLHYYKMHFHEGENEYFSQGIKYKSIKIKGVKLGLAICADTSITSHMEALKSQGAEYYLCSSLITAKGYDNDIALLQANAKKYGMGVTVSNFVGTSGGWQTTGKSLIMNSKGDIVQVASDNHACIITSVISV